jgi:hypothetical protein
MVMPSTRTIDGNPKSHIVVHADADLPTGGHPRSRPTDALNRISGEVRHWRLHHWTGHTIAEVAARVNPIVRGWMQYYGAFYRVKGH